MAGRDEAVSVTDADLHSAAATPGRDLKRMTSLQQQVVTSNAQRDLGMRDRHRSDSELCVYNADGGGAMLPAKNNVGAVHLCVAAGSACPGTQACEESVTGRLVAAMLSQGDQQLGDVSIERSKGVHLGHVTYVMGPVNVTRVLQKNTISQQIIVTSDEPIGEEQGEREVEMVRRLEWLAQPPIGPLEPLQTPVSIVVISHTATDGSTSMGRNTMVIRRLQMLHIEGRQWHDIAYNFMVGMDGRVYEGRGWSAAPEHVGRSGITAPSTLSVAFVGSFSTQLPSADALTALHPLLRLGERDGVLSSDYCVLAECQLDTDTESPGRALFNLMKDWPRWLETPPTLP